MFSLEQLLQFDVTQDRQYLLNFLYLVLLVVEVRDGRNRLKPFLIQKEYIHLLRQYQ